ncbi:ROK family protein [Enterococcus sp.]|uniref:ROK family protein n=1 Tax=Enterococcus sp. TaxID=35783 RepID=UPI003C75F137
MHNEKIVVFDLGGSAVKFGIWQDNHLTNQGQFTTPTTWGKLKEKLFQIKESLCDDAMGIAMSCPGAVSVRDGIIYGNSAIPYIHNFLIRNELTDLFQLPVSIQNDANCAALAEVWRGNARNVDSAVFMIIGSGIGGAFTFQGNLMIGKHLFGGEFGWMLVNNHQTLSEVGSPVKMAQKFSEIKGDKVYTGKEVFTLYEHGDELAVTLVDKMLDALAIGLYNLCISYDADRYLIGGGISARSDVITKLQLKVKQLLNLYDASEIHPEIRACRFLNEANLIGAVYQFMLEKENVKPKKVSL